MKANFDLLACGQSCKTASVITEPFVAVFIGESWSLPSAPPPSSASCPQERFSRSEDVVFAPTPFFPLFSPFLFLPCLLSLFSPSLFISFFFVSFFFVVSFYFLFLFPIPSSLPLPFLTVKRTEQEVWATGSPQQVTERDPEAPAAVASTLSTPGRGKTTQPRVSHPWGGLW